MGRKEFLDFMREEIKLTKLIEEITKIRWDDEKEVYFDRDNNILEWTDYEMIDLPNPIPYKDEENDVDDYITGYIRTDKASISFNGAWAQNIDARDMFIDILGDKGGARLDYGGKFVYYNGSDLSSFKPEYHIDDMYENESRGFIESITTGVKNRSNIDQVLETAKLLQALYDSADIKKEISF